MTCNTTKRNSKPYLLAGNWSPTFILRSPSSCVRKVPEIYVIFSFPPIWHILNTKLCEPTTIAGLYEKETTDEVKEKPAQLSRDVQVQFYKRVFIIMSTSTQTTSSSDQIYRNGK